MDKIIRLKGISRLFFIFGSGMIGIGFFYFLGLISHNFEQLYGTQIPNNSLWGITYLELYIFGFYLVCIGIILNLLLMEGISNKNLEKLIPIWILAIFNGFELIIYAILVKSNLFNALMEGHSWFDYFALGILLVIISFMIFLLTYGVKKIYEQYKRILELLILIGIFSLLITIDLQILEPSVLDEWSIFFFLGILLLFLGGLPYSLYKQSSKPYGSIIFLISLFCILIGLFIYLVPTLALNKIVLDLTIFNQTRYFDFLLYGSLLAIIGVTCLTFTQRGDILNRHERMIIILFFIGIVQYLISIILEISDNYLLEIGQFLDRLGFLERNSGLHGYSIFGMTWDVFFFNGTFITILSLILISSIIMHEKQIFNKINKKPAETTD